MLAVRIPVKPQHPHSFSLRLILKQGYLFVSKQKNAHCIPLLCMWNHKRIHHHIENELEIHVRVRLQLQACLDLLCSPCFKKKDIHVTDSSVSCYSNLPSQFPRRKTAKVFCFERKIMWWTISCVSQAVLCVRGTSRRLMGSCRSSAPGTTMTLTSELESQGPPYRSVRKYVLLVS